MRSYVKHRCSPAPPRRRPSGPISAVRPGRSGHKHIVLLSLLVTLLGSPGAALRADVELAPFEDNRQVFGWLERVKVSHRGLVVEAKLDTGADNSSLHAENIKSFNRGGKSMVRFYIADARTGELVELERKRVRRARIREHDGTHQQRPVIEMWVCLGNLKKRIEVNLVDRSQFNVPFLLGRSAMHGDVLVDPDQTFTIAPNCNLRGLAQ